MAWAATLSALAFYVGDRWGMMACSYRNPIEGLSESLSPALAYDILLDPLALSLEAMPLICGLSLFVATWYAFEAFANRPAELREGDEHGSARMGSAKELRGYADHRDESNNIVLSSNVSIAIEGARGVRRRLPSQNVIVYGPSGTGKTTAYVMTNILQLADRDMVVVDPKGQTLAKVGHALAASGFDISVLNLKDLAASDRYNPLAAIRDYDDAVAFAQMLVRAVNEGRRSSEPIWEQGPTLLFRAVITLMLDWFPREEMTFDNLVSLVSLARTPDRGPGSRSALDLLFDEIATGECWVHDTGAEEGGAEEADPFAPAGAGAPTRRGRLVRVPSLMRRRDGMRPAREVRPGGGHGTDDDEALQVWRQFRSGATRTLQSFLVTAFSSLAHLTTRRVRELLAAEDGVDELRLDLLGQREDECGQPLPPRVVFVVASDTSPSLRPLLSIAMWQAVTLPVRAADDTPSGELPRHLSIVLDEFRNVGRLDNFAETVATVRSRNIDVEILLQTGSQLAEVYEELGAKTIRGNCAATVVLGGVRDHGTAKLISEEIGKATVHKRETSTQHGAGGTTTSTSEHSVARDVLDPSEVATLDDGKAIVLVGQEAPVVDDKAVVWEHRNYEEAYMARKPERHFDYAQWRRAGRPKRGALAAWEEAWYEGAEPARKDLDAARKRLAQALKLLKKAESEGDAALVAARRENVESAGAAAREAEHAFAQARDDAARVAERAMAEGLGERVPDAHWRPLGRLRRR